MSWYGGSKYLQTWRPVSIADANRYSISWSRRNDARDQLDDLTYEDQTTAARSAIGRKVQAAELKTRPQRGPLHTSFPAYPAARACLGLSAICEFNAQAGPATALLRRAATPPAPALMRLDPYAVKQTSEFVAQAVSNRLCIDQLHRIEKLGAVESYRLFAAATIDLRFRRLKDVILGACTMGDLVFALLEREPVRRRLHELTVRILTAIAPACGRYEAASAGCRPEQLPALGGTLAKELMAALVPLLPLRSAQPSQGGAGQPSSSTRRPKRVPVRKPFPVAPEESLSLPLPGSDEPVPPAIDQPGPWRTRGAQRSGIPQRPMPGGKRCGHCGTVNPGLERSCLRCGRPLDARTGPSRRQDAGAVAEPRSQAPVQEAPNRLPRPGPASPAEAQAQSILQHAASVMAQATGRSQYDDPRVDQVTLALREAMYAPGAVEAQLAARREKVVAYGSARGGAIHEEALQRCRDENALGQLRRGAAPIEKKLRGYKWFGQRREVTVNRHQVRGALDPRRLHRLATSSRARPGGPARPLNVASCWHGWVR